MSKDKNKHSAEAQEAAQQYSQNQPDEHVIHGEVVDNEADMLTEQSAPIDAEQAPSNSSQADQAEDESTSQLAQLQTELDAAGAKIVEHKDQLLRMQAELDNTRKRSERDVVNARKFGLDKVMAELLSVRDSLELGIQAAQAGQVDVEKMREGSELTLSALASVMEKFGVEQIDPLDQVFNPDFHQAVSLQPAEDVAANTVMSVMQKGYMLNGRLIRPAMVVVAKGA